MKKPNFFIVGAPKSGTTALSEYLRQHPNIFICKEKEPNFWNDDFHNVSQVSTLEEYLALFEDAQEQHVVIGEATVNYLYSERALPRIWEFNPEARLVALLRNPVDLAYSWHSQMLFGLYEDEPDFERAWNLQAERAEGRHLPKHCVEPKVLQYKKIALLGEQVERMLSIFPRDQIQLCLFDDFRIAAGSVYRNVLQFLGLPDDGRTEFPVINENKIHRHALLARLIERPPRFWTASARMIKNTLGLQSIGLLKRMREINKVPVKRSPMPQALRRRLVEEFRDDILKLQAILGRDLSHWLAVNETTTVETHAGKDNR